MSIVDVYEARRRIAPYIRRTPLVESPWASDAARARVWLKLESLQRTNAFKARGAFNAVLARRERGRIDRIVTASAGNHGRALADAAAVFGVPLVVFTPNDAPAAKLDAIRRCGADLRADAPDYDEAERRAKAFARDSGAEFISPYNDADVIAGAATVAVEMFEDAPELDTFVVPIGGGGLVSGVARVVKAIDPSRAVIGVELEASHPFHASIAAGRLVEIVAGPTLADGLGGNPDPETMTWPYIQQAVDRIALVSERQLRDAIAGLVAHEHVVAEGAGAASVAALVSNPIDVAGRRVGAIVTGANIDRARLADVLSSASQV
ncbi:MAG TPA: threonine/serine dehydratase [Vicinamibacterales bacterium]|nr:threonine/serine dehydratase [Vicinamibacterales bacterium]